MDRPYTVLFVCMGNICRSPTAHGVFRARIAAAGLEQRVAVESAGTHNYHPGAAPDNRSQRHARRRGYNLADLRARQIDARDFERADLILAMDWDNLARMKDLCPPEHRGKLRRFTEFCVERSSEVVPDPYYGGAGGFEHVLDLIEDASEGLLRHVRHQLDASGAPAGPAAMPD
jgi:protein-tyrosine phosphatase